VTIKQQSLGYRQLSCFKAYDIRGKLGDQLDEDVAYRIGRAYGQYLQAKTMVVGGDVRQTSEPLKTALANGLMDAGVDAIDIGMVGTEEIYYATSLLQTDGGIEVTASHNPIDYNGMKLVKKGSVPISGDTGLNDVKALAEGGQFEVPEHKGSISYQDTLSEYVQALLDFIDVSNLTRPLKLVVNAGNGAAGHVIDALEKRFEEQSVPIQFIKVHHQPDPSFPNGIPNPLLPENRAATANIVKREKADMGIAWDGDFDRCFLFDENGRFIEGYYIVGLLAQSFLQKHPGAKIIHDPRLTWNTQDIVARYKGVAIQSKTGHAFIKERMRLEDAIYGGEMSAHHYFRDFAYCDSGMIPWLLVAELLCVKGACLSELVDEAILRYPSSGEINRKVKDADATVSRVKDIFVTGDCQIDETDGLSVAYRDWRFNLRKSNTEPVIRLNVESRGDSALMERKTQALLSVIDGTS